ncbi:unnamed protein product [Gadus morhua 'NCC']
MPPSHAAPKSTQSTSPGSRYIGCAYVASHAASTPVHGLTRHLLPRSSRQQSPPKVHRASNVSPFSTAGASVTISTPHCRLAACRERPE